MYEKMISKELLSEVLELKRIDDIYTEDNIVYFCELNDGINIYELQHKCKEWVVNNGYELVIYKDGIEIYCEFHKVHGISNLAQQEFIAYDVNLVFEACEWVLKEVKKWEEK